MTTDGLDPDEIVIAEACKDCGQLFSLTRAAVMFFTDKRLELPKRCLDCRRKRRLRREREEAQEAPP